MGKDRYHFLIAAADRTKQRFLQARARAAQRRKEWQLAERLWRESWQGAPENKAATIGYAGILIYTGDVERAEPLVGQFIRQHPEDENGPVLRARLAEARGDSAAAIDQWHAALAIKPGHLQSLVRLGALLLASGRLEEAETCAERLLSGYPAEAHGAILRAQVAQARHGYAGAAPLWKEVDTAFSGEVPVLRAFGRALIDAAEYDGCLAVAERLRQIDRYESSLLAGEVLLTRRRYDDHTEFWESASAELPKNANLARRWIDAALRARRLVDAEAGFQRLLAQKQLRAADADFVVGLANAHIANGNKGPARAMVRSFLARMRTAADYRAAALRLHRIILVCFPRNPGAALRISRSPQIFPRMVRAARLSASATDVLIASQELELALARTRAKCLFDTDIEPAECDAFIRIVHARLAQGEPFSLIRVGDAESNAFAYEAGVAEQFEADVQHRERVWWGRTLDTDARKALAARVRHAIAEADALGIPTRSRFLRDIRLDSPRSFCAATSGRGLIAIMRILRNGSQLRACETGVLTSAHIHQDLQRWSLYPALFAAVREVVVVSCHAGLAEAMRSRFDIHIAKAVIVPPGDAARELQNRSLADSEMPPQRIERALEELGDWPRGRLVLVGAGYAGKIIVQEAKRSGGVVLDLGSIFDTWVGANTRSYQDFA